MAPRFDLRGNRLGPVADAVSFGDLDVRTEDQGETFQIVNASLLRVQPQAKKEDRWIWNWTEGLP
jgi:hypothetical protein